MNRQSAVVCVGWACWVTALCLRPLFADQDTSDSFREILELAELGPEVLAQIGNGPEYGEEDWQIVLQVFDRLQRFDVSNRAGSNRGSPSRGGSPIANPLSLSSSQDREAQVGQIFDLAGIISSVQELSLPEPLAERHGLHCVYLCRLRLLTHEPADAGVVTVLTMTIPNRWRQQESFHESVQVRGVLIQAARRDVDQHWQTLLLTHHIAWYPTSHVPTGQQLLARHGMDVALLDEVRHRQPFVKPEVSREGEAFYAALAALRQVEPQDLIRLAVENVASKAAAWRAAVPELQRTHQRLKATLADETDLGQRKILQAAVKAARDRQGLAAAVIESSDAQRSSVAPLFLQPEEETGELVNFEGVARRAIRIAVTAGPAGEPPDLDAYYELEIFTADSQNLPIVCCVLRLPPNFPTGDEIREPVRLAGIFFKNWRYRSRKLVDRAGETGQQRQLYTPVLLGKVPIWLKPMDRRSGYGSLWGGIAFLGGLVTLWISMSWLASRDRVARVSLRRDRSIDL